MFPSRFAVVLVALQISACGGNALDLGDDAPGPPRLADGSIDETAPWAITGHPTNASALAVDATRVYWSTLNSVKSCQPVRCGRTTITYHAVSNGDVWVIPMALALGGSRLFWGAYSGRRPAIFACPVSGCPKEGATIFADGSDVDANSTSSFVADDTHLYWLTTGSDVMRCSLSGCKGTHETFASLDSPPKEIASGPSTIYAIVEGSIIALGKESSMPPRVLTTETHHPTSVVADAERVFWANSYSQGTIAACPVAGCTDSPEVLASGLPYPVRLALDATNLYALENSKSDTSPGELLECPLSGCGDAPRSLASGLTVATFGLALDATHVYFTDDDVIRVGK